MLSMPLSGALNKTIHSRRTVAVEILLWLQCIYRSLSATVRTHWPQLPSSWLQRQDLTWQPKTMHPAEHFPAGTRRYKPGDELDSWHDWAPAQSPCPTRQLWRKALSCFPLVFTWHVAGCTTSVTFHHCALPFIYELSCIVHLTISHLSFLLAKAECRGPSNH